VEGFDFFFRLRGGGGNVSITIDKGLNRSKPLFPLPEADVFHRVYGHNIIFEIPPTSDSRVTIDTLTLKNATCPNYSFGLAIDRYINASYTIAKGDSSSVCYIFYQPGADYHVNVDCLSLDRNAICRIYSQQTLLTDAAPVPCPANSTCATSLADGLLVSVTRSKNESVISTLSLFEIKGRHSQDRCNATLLDRYNASGRLPFISEDLSLVCDKPREPVILAVVLIASLLLILTLALVICFKCRPNREVYVESDDTAGEVKQVRKRPSDPSGTRPVIVSDVGYEKRDLFMPLCD
jgi:hypothetical protein